MKILTALLVSLGLAGAVFAKSSKVPDISHADLEKAVAAKAVVLLDANGTDSFQEGRIPGAIDYSAAKAKLAGFVYASNRGHDSLAVFEVTAPDGAPRPIQTLPSGGRTPRNFALSPDGRWLVCGHQDTPLLTVFQVDEKTGLLTQTPHTAEVPVCICVAFRG